MALLTSKNSIDQPSVKEQVAATTSRYRWPGVLLLVLVIGLLAALGYQRYATPAAQARRTSDAFMKALTSANTTRAATYAASGVTGPNQNFLKQDAAFVSGPFKLQSRATKNGNYYFLYTLANSAVHDVRTTVSQQQGSWKITALSYSQKQLTPLPLTDSPPHGIPSDFPPRH